MKTFSLSLLAVFGLAIGCYAQETSAIPAKNFTTPIEASDAFIAATKNGENPALLEIFGDKHKDLIGTDDPERDRELRAKVAAMAVERRRFRFNDENSVTMVLGAEAWPFPIPIIKNDAGWHFDTDSGILEIVKRRIGENELSVIDMMKAFVEAQALYAKAPRDGSDVMQYARKFQSSPGKHDGLYWPTDDSNDGEPSPAGPEIKDSETSYCGYHFKILTAQGKGAPGGKYDYLINGYLIGGVALLAWPSDYGKTGVMTFTVNQFGIVHQRDLGPETSKLAPLITAYLPEKGWEKVTP